MAGKPRSLALVGLGEGGIDARVRRGGANYLRPLRTWRIVDGKGDRSYWPRVLAADVDGVIAHVTDRPFEKQLLALDRPVVNLSQVLAETSFPTVSCDSAGLGVMGADYFLGRGFEHFATVPRSHRLCL